MDDLKTELNGYLFLEFGVDGDVERVRGLAIRVAQASGNLTMIGCG